MKKQNKNNRRQKSGKRDPGYRPLMMGIAVFFGILLTANAALIATYSPGISIQVIDSFRKCMDAGYEVTGSNPRQCVTPSGNVFIEPIDPTSVDFERIEDAEPIRDVEHFQTHIIRSVAHWFALFHEIDEDRMDFENYIAIAVFLGERNTGGYSIQAIEIIETQDRIEVRMLERQPDEQCAVTDVVEYPFEVIMIPKTDKQIVVIVNQEVYSC
jgi:hypothetical protein